MSKETLQISKKKLLSYINIFSSQKVYLDLKVYLGLGDKAMFFVPTKRDYADSKGQNQRTDLLLVEKMEEGTVPPEYLSDTITDRTAIQLCTVQELYNALMTHEEEDAMIKLEIRPDDTADLLIVKGDITEPLFTDLIVKKGMISYPYFSDMEKDAPKVHARYTTGFPWVYVKIMSKDAFIKQKDPGSSYDLVSICTGVTSKFSPTSKVKKGDRFMVSEKEENVNDKTTHTTTSEDDAAKEKAAPTEKDKNVKSAQSGESVKEQNEKTVPKETQKDASADTPSKPKKKRRSPAEVLEEKIRKAKELLKENGYAVAEVQNSEDNSKITIETVKITLSEVLKSLDNINTEITPEQALQVLHQNVISK